MIPILYASSETSFTSNGIGRLTDCTRCEVTEERNGVYECEFVYPVSGRHYADIDIGCIIACTHDDDGDVQPFDIYRRSAPLGGLVTFNARHISYRLANVILSPYTASNVALALSGLTSNAINANPFTFTTDKTTTATFTLSEPSSVRGIMGGVEGSLLDVYGGEYEFDKFNVKLWAARGTASGIQIRYGKNLSQLDQTVEGGGLYNALVPFWKGTDADGTEALVTCSPAIVKAAGVTAATVPVVMDFSADISEQPTAAELETAALAYLANNTPWIPKENIKIDFIQLWQTTEYADYANLEKVRLCDTVSVYYPALGVTAVGVKVIKVVYDVLRDRYSDMELGEPRASFADVITTQTTSEITKTSLEDKSFFAAAIANATDLITGGKGGHLIISRNSDGEPEELLIMDTDSALTATYIIRMNLGGIGFSTDGGNTYTTAWTIDGHFLADYIDTGTLRAIMIEGPTADTFWNLTTGIFQNYGETSVTAQVETSSGTYTPTTYNIAHKTRIADGKLTLRGSHGGGTETPYMAVGLAAEGMDYEYYESVYSTGHSTSYPYAGVDLYGDQVDGLGERNLQTGGEDITYTPAGHYTPDYLIVGVAENVSDAVYNPDRNTMKVAGGWGTYEDALVYTQYYTWEIAEGVVTRTFYDGVERRPCWEYAVNDVVQLFDDSLSDFRIVCTGYITDSQTTLWFLIPLARPFAKDVAAVTLEGSWKARLEGSYIAGRSDSYADLTSYTVTTQITAAGLAVKVKKTNNGTWSSGNNNHAVTVDLYDDVYMTCS